MAISEGATRATLEELLMAQPSEMAGAAAAAGGGEAATGGSALALATMREEAKIALHTAQREVTVLTRSLAHASLRNALAATRCHDACALERVLHAWRQLPSSLRPGSREAKVWL